MKLFKGFYTNKPSIVGPANNGDMTCTIIIIGRAYSSSARRAGIVDKAARLLLLSLFEGDPLFSKYLLYYHHKFIDN